MGGGASRQRSRGSLASPRHDPAQLWKPPKDRHELASLQRRRRLLLGTPPDKINEFEKLNLADQFTVGIPNDTVFDRYGSFEAVNEVRASADATRYLTDGGYLNGNAIGHLGLGLESGSYLAVQLFKLAQVQQFDKRRALLTCYEFLALYSVLRFGQNHELLELLYCVFDSDLDDRLSAADLTHAIDAFMALRGATECLAEEDRREFAGLKDSLRRKEAEHLALKAIQDFGIAPSDAESSTDADEPTERLDEEKRLAAGAHEPGSAAADEATRKRGSSPHSDTDSDLASTTPQDAGQKPLDGADGTPKAAARKSWGCGALSRGRSPSSKRSDSAAKAAPTQRARSCGRLCRGKTPADEESDGGPVGESKSEQVTKKANAHGKVTSRRKKTLLRRMFSSQKCLPALDYQHFNRWLSSTKLLPPGLVDVDLYADYTPKLEPPRLGRDSAAASAPVSMAGRQDAVLTTISQEDEGSQVSDIFDGRIGVHSG